jgi:nitrate reductase gamma subunit
MTLLDFARGPAFYWAFAIMIAGILWRLAGIVFFTGERDISKPKETGRIAAGLRVVALRSVPPHELEKNITFQHFTGYVWHIGFFITFLFLGAHMPFIRSMLGFAWPNLPNGVILVVSAITLGILLTLYVRRIFHPVLKVITDADDHVSVLLTMLPLITGVAAFAHWSPFGVRYENVLAIHILSICALMIWLPFGKIFHAVTALIVRFRTGVAFIRRGVRA